MRASSIQLILVLLTECTIPMLEDINMESFFTEANIYAHMLPLQKKMMTFLVGVCDDKARGKKYAEEGCIPLLVRCLQKHTEDAAFCEETMRVLGFVLLADKAMTVFVDNGGLSVVIDLMKKYESRSEIIYRGYLLLWIVCHTQDYCMRRWRRVFRTC